MLPVIDPIRLGVPVPEPVCLCVCADTSEDMTDGFIKLKPFDYTLANVDHDSDGSQPKEELAEDVVLHMVNQFQTNE